MLLHQLFEAIDKRHAAFAFGRMNPPTLGHGQLIDTVANASAGGDYFIFVSQTQDKKKNPLDYQTKIKFVKAMFPKHAGHVVQESQLKTIMQIAHWLYKKGYRSVTFVAGSDRIEGFTELLNKYNGNGQEGDAGYYKFDNIKVVSSGDRDPDAEGIAGVSASAAREAAAAGNLEAFAQATGAGKLAPALYQAVRKGMLLENITGKLPSGETMNINGADLERLRKLPQYKQGYDAQLRMSTGAPNNSYEMGSDQYNAFYIGTSDAFVKKNSFIDNVAEGASGYIPKNKKEAKDPRWSNALTVDVHPDTPNKNMKALRLI
jgi:hypothetical protein